MLLVFYHILSLTGHIFAFLLAFRSNLLREFSSSLRSLGLRRQPLQKDSLGQYSVDQRFTLLVGRMRHVRGEQLRRGSAKIAHSDDDVLMLPDLRDNLTVSLSQFIYVFSSFTFATEIEKYPRQEVFQQILRLHTASVIYI